MRKRLERGHNIFYRLGHRKKKVDETRGIGSPVVGLVEMLKMSDSENVYLVSPLHLWKTQLVPNHLARHHPPPSTQSGTAAKTRRGGKSS